VVIAKSTDQTLKRNIQEVLLTMHEDLQAAKALRAGAIERFVQVQDEDYQDIRMMRDCSQAYLSTQNLQLHS
jgi:ABC-type phosphate/phosphonate transport system substrate-binding protein